MQRRRAALVLGLPALGLLALALLSAGCGSSSKAALETVNGSWVIVPQTPGPPFQALAAFGSGGVFITTGSDQAGTGIGQWVAQGANSFAFSYRNFHFGTDGRLSSITTVNAQGTFQGGTMQGTATQSVAGPAGEVLMAPQGVSFTGTRFQVTAP